MRQEAGKASFTSTAGKTNADIAAMGGSSISKDYDTLTELKEKRAVKGLANLGNDQANCSQKNKSSER
jgi:hypothetical protein